MKYRFRKQKWLLQSGCFPKETLAIFIQTLVVPGKKTYKKNNKKAAKANVKTKKPTFSNLWASGASNALMGKVGFFIKPWYFQGKTDKNQQKVAKTN